MLGQNPSPKDPETRRVVQKFRLSAGTISPSRKETYISLKPVSLVIFPVLESCEIFSPTSFVEKDSGKYFPAGFSAEKVAGNTSRVFFFRADTWKIFFTEFLLTNTRRKYFPSPFSRGE